MNTDATAMDLFFRRIGDAERSACVEILIEHHVQGRLSVTELSQRQEAALKATTGAELAGLVADLPHAGDRSGSTSSVALNPNARTKTAMSLMGDSEPIKTWTRRLGPPAAVAVTALTVTAGIGTNAETAMHASLVTGAVGYLSAWLAARWK